jgi:hypothetical protein
MSRGGVVINAGPSAGVDVHGGVIEAGDLVDELVLSLVGDRVGLDDAELVIDSQGDLGVHPVPDPAQLDAVNTTDAGHIAYRFFGGVDQVGVDCVHQSAVDVAGRAAQDTQNRACLSIRSFFNDIHNTSDQNGVATTD